MRQYGEVAVRAVAMLQERPSLDPRAAWEDAAAEILQTRSLQEKACPRSTFLALCQEGFVSGVSRGRYTNAKENREHALDAVRRLQVDPAARQLSPDELWKTVLDGGTKTPNSQMDVVLALWRAGHLGSPVAQSIRLDQPEDGEEHLEQA